MEKFDGQTWRSTNPLLTIAAFGSVVLNFALLVTGTIRQFSPVPVSDMWDAGINWFVNHEFSIQSFWLQHNEHRPAISRVLIFLDYKFFGGVGQFLVILNLIFIFTIFVILVKASLSDSDQNQNLQITSIIGAATVLSWSQNENLHGAFQGSFLLGFLFPIMSFWQISLFIRTNKSTHLVWSLVAGVLSVITLANGLLVLPIISAILLLTRKQLRYSILSLCLSLVAISLYYLNYVPVGGHSNPLVSILKTPFDVALYSLAFLGNPVASLPRDTGTAIAASVVTGSLVVIWYLIVVIKTFRARKISNRDLIYLTTGSFLVATSILTASGRINFGIESALSSRYATPALIMIFLTIVSIFSSEIFITKREKYILAFVIFSFSFVNQIPAATSNSDGIEIKERAAIALAMNISDDGAISSIYPDAQRALDLSVAAREAKVTIFASDNFLELSQNNQQTVVLKKCIGYVDLVESLPGDLGYFYVEGWAKAVKEPDAGGKVITLFDIEGRPTGKALTGKFRQDVMDEQGKAFGYSGFKGYVQIDEKDRQISAGQAITAC